MLLIGEIGAQTADIARTEGQIRAINAAKETHPNYSAEQLRETDIYKAEMQKYGTGSEVQRAIQAATAAVQGLAGGDMQAAIAGGAAPYIANVIAQTVPETNMTGRVLAHATVNAALAAMQGKDGATAAAGAATGELMGMIATEAYGKTVGELSEEEKQTISALATLASGLAGGLAGDSTASALAGAQSGKTTVENNYLSFDEARAFDKEMTACKASGDDCDAVIRKYDSLNKENREELQQALATDPLVVLSGETKWNVEGGLSAANRPDWLYGSLDNRDVRDYVASNNNYDLNYINSHTTNGDRALAFIGEPENFRGLVTGGRSLFSSSTTMSAKLTSLGLSLGANGGVQALNGNIGDKFDYVSFFTSGFTGIGGAGKSLHSNLQLNVGGAYFSSQVTGQNSEAAMVGAAAGTGIGYAVGSRITSRLEAKAIKDYFGMPASSNALKYTEKAFGPGYLLEDGKMSPVPGILGGAGSSLSQEAVGSSVQNGNNK